MAPVIHTSIRQSCRGFLVLRILLFLFVVALIAIPALLLFAGIESAPLVEPTGQLSHQDIARIRHVLRQHDPRHLRKQEVRTLSLTERDLNLLLKYAAPRNLQTSSQADLQPDRMQARITVKLPDNPLGRYLNISTTMSTDDDGLHIARLSVGRLALPGWLLEPLLEQKHRLLLKRSEDYRMAVESLDSLRFREDSLVMVYQLDPELVDRLRQRSKQYLFPAEDVGRMLVYHEELARIANRSTSFHVSLAEVLPPLFQLAASGTTRGGKPQDENRALILTLALHALGMDIGRFIGTAQEPADIKLHMTLLERHDLVQHYLVSAALTVSAGSGLAGAIGVFKELDDSRRGTGFSFPDLLADRAGIRLAEMATGRTQQASLLQQRLGGPLSETDFMPAIDALPEGIMELEFKHRYRDLDSEAYRLVEDEINHRLSRCKAYSPG